MQFRLFQPAGVLLAKKLVGFLGSIALAQVAAGVDGLPGVAGALEFGDAEIRFKPVMRGERSFQSIPAFHFDQPGDIRAFKSCPGFQPLENPQ